MKHSTKYVGLDVSKSKVAVAIADEGRESSRFWGVIPHTKEAMRKLMKQLQTDEVTLKVCYEAGCTGFEMYRWLLEMNIDCEVVAPSLMPTRVSDRVKTDKRDALRLAQLLRAGELTNVYVPTVEDEAFRDLVRGREDAKEDLNRHQQRLGKFLLRQQRYAPEKVKTWTTKYEEWLDTVRFAQECQQITFQEYRQSIQETKQRLARYEKEIEQQATISSQAPLIQALQALRGIKVLTATTIAVELGDISGRFGHPSYLMSYAGLVPRERSTGGSRWQGGLTKAGNTHVRRVLVESAWSYRYTPGVRKALRERTAGLPPAIQAISWEAQTRLHKKYKTMMRQGKHKGVIAAAIARELLGFVWAIAQELNQSKKVA
ncbi:IS110 family transposase [Mycobacterium gordonae]|nr:IS110 family transposase [Mycobacterium gordonae]